ncbi:MAG: ATPase [Actinomycetota bacterium]|nr:ATPase [Actinomycetota bacterium]
MTSQVPQGLASLETLLRDALELVDGAKAMPLSNSVLVSRDELTELLAEALDAMPEEIRQARRLLRQRDELLERAEREAEAILGAARERAEHMVSRTEVVREAEHRAQRLVDEASDESRQLRYEAEDYCEHMLSVLESGLEKSLASVHEARDRVASVQDPPQEDEPEDDDGLVAPRRILPFDQDRAP